MQCGPGNALHAMPAGQGPAWHEMRPASRASSEASEDASCAAPSPGATTTPHPVSANASVNVSIEMVVNFMAQMHTDSGVKVGSGVVLAGQQRSPRPVHNGSATHPGGPPPFCAEEPQNEFGAQVVGLGLLGPQLPGDPPQTQFDPAPAPQCRVTIVPGCSGSSTVRIPANWQK